MKNELCGSPESNRQSAMSRIYIERGGGASHAPLIRERKCICVGGQKTGDVSRLARMRFVVRHAGFEPATFRLKVGYSTTELMARIEGKRGRCGKRMEGHFSHPFIKFSRAFP